MHGHYNRKWSKSTNLFMTRNESLVGLSPHKLCVVDQHTLSPTPQTLAEQTYMYIKVTVYQLW